MVRNYYVRRDVDTVSEWQIKLPVLGVQTSCPFQYNKIILIIGHPVTLILDNINTCTITQIWFIVLIAIKDSFIYTIIRHKSVHVRKLQVAILAQSFREMSLTDRILLRYILSRVRVWVRPIIFVYAKNPQTTVARRSRSPLSGQINNLIGNDVIHPAL